MIEEMLRSMASSLIPSLFSAGVVWGMIKTELKYLRRDVDLAHKEIVKSRERCIINHQEVHP